MPRRRFARVLHALRRPEKLPAMFATGCDTTKAVIGSATSSLPKRCAASRGMTMVSF